MECRPARPIAKAAYGRVSSRLGVRTPSRRTHPALAHRCVDSQSSGLAYPYGFIAFGYPPSPKQSSAEGQTLVQGIVPPVEQAVAPEVESST